MSSIIDSQKQFKQINETLDKAAQKNLNVILRGESGVGKTHMVMDVANKYDLKFKYFSASTLDPFADLIGIPVPKEDHVEYLRLQEINDAEFMFFDELNRAHKRVTNAVLEIIQFKTLNGEPLPNLKMVWAAINPWEQEGYNTEILDLALQGRFHFNIDVPYNISYDYMEEKYGEDIAKIAFNWWWELADDLRTKFQPRRLDYTLEIMLDKLNYEYSKPFDVTNIPLKKLNDLVEVSLMSIGIKEIIDNPAKFIQIAEEADIQNPEYVSLIRIVSSIEKDIATIMQILDVIIALPADYLANIISRNHNYGSIREKIYQTKGVEELMKCDQIIQQKINA